MQATPIILASADTPVTPPKVPLPEAVHHLAAATEKAATATERGTQGMGAWAMYGNTTAMAVIIGLAVLCVRFIMTSATEDRSMYREEMRDTRKDHKDATDTLMHGLSRVEAAVHANTAEVKQAGRDSAAAASQAAQAAKDVAESLKKREGGGP